MARGEVIENQSAREGATGSEVFKSCSPDIEAINDDFSRNTQLETDHLTACYGKDNLILTKDVVCQNAAEKFHMESKDRMAKDWNSYQDDIDKVDWVTVKKFVRVMLEDEGDFTDEKSFNRAFRNARKAVKMCPPKPQVIKAYSIMLNEGEIAPHAVFERLFAKKTVRCNSGVVVITVVTSPGNFSCPNDCHYCPNEPGQPRSYLSTEPAVLRANQNEFDPVRQFYDRAQTLAKQGHAVDKVEIIVLGGTWSAYPKDYQEQFCRDLFYAANTFDDEKVRRGVSLEDSVNQRDRLPILEEQVMNETARTKIIGLTLETRPDHVSVQELKRLRKFGCTRVQIGIQHTDDEILDYINRGHKIQHAVNAVRLLKVHGFKVDIHLMPDLPGSNVEKDMKMFDYVLNSDKLQADHWKIYPCEVTPFTKIEEWYREGKYMPYTEEDPQKLVELLVSVKARVPPWIRLNRVIRDIPEVSIIAGNANTNLRQLIFTELEKRGLACRCIRCREVRDWPEDVGMLHLNTRHYRSSEGDEYFIAMEGGARGAGGGAMARGLKPTKLTKKQKRERKGQGPRWRGRPTKWQLFQHAASEKIAYFKRYSYQSLRPVREIFYPPIDNPTLYGLLRLRFNDDPTGPEKCFPELSNCALIRELHVYGQLVAARQCEGGEGEKPQHKGVGKQLMERAELMARSKGFKKIAVIAGVGVRNYYRKLGYELSGEGQYLIKNLDTPEIAEKAEELFPSFSKKVADNVSNNWPTYTAVATAAAALGAFAYVKTRN